VVELVALDRATIKYSTIQNWYPGDEAAKAAFTTSSPSAANGAGANSKISWTQVETGSAITGKYRAASPGRQLHRRVLLGGGDQSPATGRHRTKMIHTGQEHALDDRLEGISAGHGQNTIAVS